MFDIKDFKPYHWQCIKGDTAVLTWCPKVGYQFMYFSDVNTQEIVAYRP